MPCRTCVVLALLVLAPPATRAADRPLTAAEARDLEKAAKAYFEAGADERARWAFDRKLDAMLVRDEPGVRQAVWKAYRDAAIHQEAKKDYDARQVRYDKHTSAYTVKQVGKKPAGGWPLVIALHGGGGVARRVNDSQWKVMQRYYRDQTGGDGYLYIALRAPNDTWNGFYDTYVPPLIINLIRQHVLFGEVDAERVHLIGYSHGGYGAFYIGPRIPDRFAAVHASAAAPSDASSIARNLRHLAFTFMIGEKDTAYGRIKRCEDFDAEVQKLRKANKGAYPVTMELKKGLGHGGLPDRDKIKELLAARRVVAPKRVTWEVSSGPTDRFYWLGVAKAEGGAVIDASVEGQAITVRATKVKRVELTLDRRLVAMDRAVTLVVNGTKRGLTPAPSLRVMCATTAGRGDVRLAGAWVVGVEAE